jgi:starch synthase
VGYRIAMLASEVTPFAKTGGLADVAGALAKTLTAAGHDVRLFMPLYSRIDRTRFAVEPVAGFDNLTLEFGGHRYLYSLCRAALPKSSAWIYLVDCPVLYGREGLYTDDPDEHLRFIALTRAAIECCQRMAFAPQILHCNDWHTAFGPLLLRAAYGWDRLFAATRSVLTIHNIGYQGIFSADRARDIGLDWSSNLLHQDDLRAGRVNSLKHGIMYADVVTTVSPTYAREILTAEFGMGLEDSLRAKAGSVVGILNGIDEDDWDPRTDPFLPEHFDADTLDVKARLKHALLTRLKLRFKARTPLFGVISRFTRQKGLDLLFETLPSVIERRDCCLVALGNGEARYEQFFAGLQQRFRTRVVYHRGYSDELAHWIEAASDVFIMPSLYEPCGLNQMYSLRYGTLPIVRRTGGLADSVELVNPQVRSGTGIVFNDFNAEAMSWALNTALDLYRAPKLWRDLQRNAMAQDFSWRRQGRVYEDLYSRLIGAAA